MPGQQPRERHDALECLEQFHRNRRNAPPGRRQLTLGASEFIMKRLPTSLRGSCASTMSLLSLAVPTACDIEEQCHKPSTRITTDFNRGGRVAKQELMSECGWEPSNEQSAGTCLFHPVSSHTNVAIWLDPPVARFPEPWITCSDEAAPAYVRDATFRSMPMCE